MTASDEGAPAIDITPRPADDAAPPPVTEPETPPAGAPQATRHDLQLGRRFFHCMNGVIVATAYAVLFTHRQIIHVFGTIACVVYVLDRVRIAYPELVERHAPWVNRVLVRAEERVRESAMIPFAIAVLLTILTVPKAAALVGIYTLAFADPLAAVIGIRFGRHPLVGDYSLEGTLAFFGASLAVAAVVLHYMTGADAIAIAAASTTVALIAAGFALLRLRIDDNLTIPLLVGFVTWITAAVYGIPLD